MRLVADWRRALDSNEYVAATLMDLSRAFDSLPHDMLLGKLRAYGLSDKACALIGRYIADRWQQVGLGAHFREWSEIIKGVPQGSILGPRLFNIFINDIFLIPNKSSLHNYADDNTLSYSHTDPAILIHNWQHDCTAILRWFKDNNIQANPDKFQAISFGRKGNNIITDFTFDNTTIHCDDSVLLLDVEFDHLLTFNNHRAGICRTSARQLAVLKRLGHLLTLKGKLAIYKSFIECNFNYCPLIWHFCSQANTNKLEKIQERAIRFIYNNYSSSLSDLLKLSGTEYLHVACEVFKIVNDLSPSFIRGLVEIKHSQYSMRRINSAFIPKARTTKYGLKSFAHVCVLVWNSLPNELRTSENYGQFRGLIRRWDGPLCRCSVCKQIIPFSCHHRYYISVLLLYYIYCR